MTSREELLAELTEWFDALDFDRRRLATRQAEYAELQRIVCAGAAQTCAPVEVKMTHTRSCSYFDDETGCTCCLEERKALATEQTMHRAWRKRAEEFEASLSAAQASATGPCPYAENGSECLLETHSFGPCLCANPVSVPAQVQSMEPAAWTNQAQLGFLKDPACAQIPMAMWAEKLTFADVPLYSAPSAPAQTTLPEDLIRKGQAFVDQVSVVLDRLGYGQVYSSTLAAMNAFKGALSTVSSTLHRRPDAAIENLNRHQVQCDETGEMIQVSRQALDETLAYLALTSKMHGDGK